MEYKYIKYNNHYKEDKCLQCGGRKWGFFNPSKYTSERVPGTMTSSYDANPSQRCPPCVCPMPKHTQPDYAMAIRGKPLPPIPKQVPPRIAPQKPLPPRPKRPLLPQRSTVNIEMPPPVPERYDLQTSSYEYTATTEPVGTDIGYSQTSPLPTEPLPEEPYTQAPVPPSPPPSPQYAQAPPPPLRQLPPIRQSVSSPRSDLLAGIQQGVSLKRASDRELSPQQVVPESHSQSADISSVLFSDPRFQRLGQQRESYQPEEEDQGEWDEQYGGYKKKSNKQKKYIRYHYRN